MTSDKPSFDGNEIQTVYLIPVEFFQEKDFIIRYKQQLKILRQKIREEEKEKVKGELNAFYFACLNSSLNETIKLEVQLLFFDTLNFYAQQYRSVDTYLNIIKTFEVKELKDLLFSKFPVKAKMVYAETLFEYYSLIKHQEPIFSLERTNLLIQAKWHLWKLYIHHIDKKNELSKLDLSHCLTLLSMCLGELSRWFEPLYYLNEAKSHLLNNPNVEYTRALILDTIKQKTCLSFNGILILKIIDSCREASRLPNILKEQKEQLKKIETESRAFLTKNKQSISKLRNHKLKVSNSFKGYSTYRKFCAINQLYLNEHSYFCNCSNATKDDLRIQTNHDHTKIDWVKPFEQIIDILVNDFILARQNYYYSMEGVKVHTLTEKKFKRNKSDDSLKNALLKNSFKSLYSLLDQIAHGIFEVMDIDYEAKLKTKYPIPDQRPKLYFLNMWDLELIEPKHFEENYYLISLYSIGQDLNNSKYAALKDFRVMRNEMEHKILNIISASDSKNTQSENGIVRTKLELLEKTKILMLLTKSAILSFTYLVRRQSKLKTSGQGISQ